MSTEKRSDEDGEYFLRWLNNDLTPEERAKMRNIGDYEEMENMRKRRGLTPERNAFSNKSSTLKWVPAVLVALLLFVLAYYFFYA